LIKDLETLTDISIKIKEILPDGGIVLLVGNLASGKTTLVKNFVESLNLSESATSPTFSILNIYDNRVYHYDIYNEGSDKFLESGLLENLEKEGYHFIEWADEKLEKLITDIGFDFIKIEIETQDKKRLYRISHDT
jgi:tRNA threonylcarbamoyladenosine biosynthesis protein TsaE